MVVSRCQDWEDKAHMLLCIPTYLVTNALTKILEALADVWWVVVCLVRVLRCDSEQLLVSGFERFNACLKLDVVVWQLSLLAGIAGLLFEPLSGSSCEWCDSVGECRSKCLELIHRVGDACLVPREKAARFLCCLDRMAVVSDTATGRVVVVCCGIQFKSYDVVTVTVSVLIVYRVLFGWGDTNDDSRPSIVADALVFSSRHSI